MINDAELQAQAIGYVTNSHQAMMSYVEEILYTMSRFQNLAYINTMVPEGASTFAYRVVDRFGRGSFLGPRGDDASSAMASQRLVAYNVHYAGIVADWTYEDLRQSIFHGYPIDTASLEAGVIGALEHIEQIMIEGDPDEDMTGIINDADVPQQALTDTIEAMEPDEIVEFLQEEATDAISRTREVVGTELRSPMVFYMPYKQAGRMVTLRTQTDMNVWKLFCDEQRLHRNDRPDSPSDMAVRVRGRGRHRRRPGREDERPHHHRLPRHPHLRVRHPDPAAHPQHHGRGLPHLRLPGVQDFSAAIQAASVFPVL